jgi:alcohol dehydrogenase class IV
VFLPPINPCGLLNVTLMQGITRAARSLRDAVADGAHNLEAKEDMSVASVMSGLCLANAKLGAWLVL